MSTLRALVTAPPAAPPRVSLVAAARIPQDPDERWVNGIAYAPENCGPVWTRAACDGTAVDAPALATPTGVTATPAATGGTLAAATYSYRVAATGGNGTTLAASAATATTTGTTSKVTVAWAQTEYATGYKVYGRTGGSELLLATITDGATTSWVDDGSGSPSGALPAANTTGGSGLDYTNAAEVDFIPFIVEAYDKCTATGFNARDWQGRVRRMLAAGESKAIAGELWSGAVAQAQSYPNRYLTDSNAVDVTGGGTALSAARGLATLEQAAGDAGSGARAMIHCTKSLATIWSASQLLRREGNLVLTVHDTIVVPDAGYPGTGPGGSAAGAGNSWAFVTTLVDVRRSAAQVFPDSFAQATDRAVNDITFRAEEFAAATFDPCLQAACKISLGS